MVNSPDDEEFKRRVDAIHEAGHAVAGTAIGRRVIRVDVEHDGTARGHCRYDTADPYPEDANKSAISDVVSGLAGPLAVFKRYGRVRPYQTDEEIAQLVQPDSDTTGWQALSADLQTRAFAITNFLLDRHWDRVLALADEVFARRILTESDHLKWIPNFWDFPVLPDTCEIVVHLADGDARREVNTRPT